LSDSSCEIQNAHFISAAKVAHCMLAGQTTLNLRNKESEKLWNTMEDGEKAFFGF